MTKNYFFLLLLIFILSPSVNAENLDLTNTEVKTIDGKTIQLGEIIGKKPVYLKFWASWCIPCREQMPHLQQSFEQYGKNVETIAININMNDSLDAVKKTQQEFKLTVPIIMDQNAALSQAFDLRATPYHVLINKEGTIIHTGHDVTDELNKKLELLATGLSDNIKEVSLLKNSANIKPLNIPKNKTTLLFFTSVWCDWYLEKSRPNMSKQCIEAQKQVNILADKFSGLNWQGVLTRLWTGEKELKAYTKKYNIPFEMSIDTTNKYFVDFKVDSFPTLIALKDGKEVFRTHAFNDSAQLQRQLKSLAAAAR